MMSAQHAFGYAQARIQARFAALPDEPDWARLAPTRTLAAFLEEARKMTPFGHWLRGISLRSDAHELERGLRAQYREAVELVAGWVPAPWREAVLWARWLAWLPMLAHLSQRGAMPDWAHKDFLVRTLLDGAEELKPKLLAAAGLSPLLAVHDHSGKPASHHQRTRTAVLAPPPWPSLALPRTGGGRSGGRGARFRSLWRCRRALAG